MLEEHVDALQERLAVVDADLARGEAAAAGAWDWTAQELAALAAERDTLAAQ